MPETRRKYEPEFREGAVRIVRETGKPIAQIARDLGIHAGTLGNWVAKDRAEQEGTERLSTDGAAELKQLRAENAQLRMERDVSKDRWPVGEGGDERGPVRRRPEAADQLRRVRGHQPDRSVDTQVAAPHSSVSALDLACTTVEPSVHNRICGP